MKKEQLYGAMLEDYSVPRYQAGGRPYVGTKADWDALADRLESKPNLAKRYEELLQGIRKYDDDPRAEHHVSGTTCQVMCPVEEVCRKEFVLENHEWIYEDFNDNFFRLRADVVGISQIMVKAGNMLMTCSKAHFENLSVFFNYIGWVHSESFAYGFPEILLSEEKYCFNMALYIGQKQFIGDEMEKVYQSMKGMYDYDMTDVSRDILGIR